MIFLSLNPGSTSTKFSLYNEETELFKSEFQGEVSNIEEKLKEQNFTLEQIDAFGIRVVHGGTKFSEPIKITSNVIEELKKISELAPLHNPPAIRIIEQLLVFNKNAKIFAVFDTAFHRTIPEKLSRYAIPKKIADDLGIQKFGFHGIACQSVVQKLKEQNALPEKLVICHLGGGASVTAVKNGQSVDTSMGFTPLDGLMMVTRSGNIDEGAVSFMQKKLNFNEKEMLDLLNKKSGIFGITGKTNIADVFEAKTETDLLARNMFMERVVKKVFASAGVLAGIDAVALSGGIGENSIWFQETLLQRLRPLSISELKIINVDEAEEMRRQVAEKV